MIPRGDVNRVHEPGSLCFVHSTNYACHSFSRLFEIVGINKRVMIR